MPKELLELLDKINAKKNEVKNLAQQGKLDEAEAAKKELVEMQRQFDIMKERTGGVSPILLLDDVFDKLDMERVEYLLQMVSGSGFGQIFITDSNKVRMDSLVEKVGGKCRNFEVKSGTIVAAE